MMAVMPTGRRSIFTRDAHCLHHRAHVVVSATDWKGSGDAIAVGNACFQRCRAIKLKPCSSIRIEYRRQEAMKRLEFEMQRLELEQQLEGMRERMAREKKTRQQDVAHEQWVTEQKRNLQAIKIEKVPNITSAPCSRSGGALFFGWVTSRRDTQSGMELFFCRFNLTEIDLSIS